MEHFELELASAPAPRAAAALAPAGTSAAPTLNTLNTLNAANAARAAHASPGGAEAARSTIGVSDVVCGVAASGNLEILVEALNPALPGTRCVIEVHSAAEGFRETWSAVLHDFVGRHPAGGLRFTLNDVGATPAVVALRLAQAHEGWCAALPDAAP